MNLGPTHFSTEIGVPVYATEDEDRVLESIRNLFPEASGKTGEHTEDKRKRLWTGRTDNLDNLKEMFQKQMIRDTARAFLMENCKGQGGRRLVFNLSKQAGLVGKASFVENPGPMGEIEIDIRFESGEDAETTIKWLTNISGVEPVGDDEI